MSDATSTSSPGAFAPEAAAAVSGAAADLLFVRTSEMDRAIRHVAGGATPLAHLHCVLAVSEETNDRGLRPIGVALFAEGRLTGRRAWVRSTDCFFGTVHGDNLIHECVARATALGAEVSVELTSRRTLAQCDAGGPYIGNLGLGLSSDRCRSVMTERDRVNLGESIAAAQRGGHEARIHGLGAPYR